MTGSLERAAAVLEPFARKARFEAAHPDIKILVPPTPTGHWVAVVPAGLIPGDATRTTPGAWNLEELMDQLDEIWPPDGGRP